jgi:hypothetical protein
VREDWNPVGSGRFRVPSQDSSRVLGISCSSLERELGPGGLSPVPKRAGLQRGTRLCVLAPLISFNPRAISLGSAAQPVAWQPHSAGEDQPLPLGAFRFQGLLTSGARLSDLDPVRSIPERHGAPRAPAPSVSRAGLLAPLAGAACISFMLLALTCSCHANVINQAHHADWFERMPEGASTGSACLLHSTRFFCRLPFHTIGYGIPAGTCCKWLMRSIKGGRAWRPVPISRSTSPTTPNRRMGSRSAFHNM